MLRKAVGCIHAGAAKSKALCGENAHLQGVWDQTEVTAPI